MSEVGPSSAIDAETAAGRRGRVLRVRWLGRVPYGEALALQRALHARSGDDHLLLLEHPHVYTMGSSAKPEHVLGDPATVGAELVAADRGGDVTYHGPGQLVGYPIVSLAEWRAGQRDVVAYVRRLEDVLIAALGDLGVAAGRAPGYPGVWVGDEKIAAIGVRVARGRTRHGFALNVDPDLSMFDHIVPCGIRDRGVTSLAALLGPAAPDLHRVADVVAARFAELLGPGEVERQDVVWRESSADLSAFTRAAAGLADDRSGRPSAPSGPTPPAADPVDPLAAAPSPVVPSPTAPSPTAPRPSVSPSVPGAVARSAAPPVRLLGRLAEAGVAAPVGPPARRPEWMRVRARVDGRHVELRKLVRALELHTVCEEAGCPNLSECWAEGTATFMILGERCTRACGFCLVDTRRPEPPDPDEPRRVAEATRALALAHVVITCVARDDLPDGGAAAFAATIAEVRAASPDTSVEVLISDCRGDPTSLQTIFAAGPDVLNHNLETVARLQRAARPSAGYARSLAVLARAEDAGLVTKSGLVLGMGETEEEVHGALADLRGVGVDIVTLGQYLQPTARHLPVVRWWQPDEFAALAEHGAALGFSHVESGPLVRSSYHARQAVAAATPSGPATEVPGSPAATASFS